MIEMVDIKDISGNIRFSTSINEGSKRKYQLMKEDYITLKFSLDNPVYFKLGDGIDNELGIFELVDLYTPTYNQSTGGYDYELRLDAYYWKWKNKIFKFNPEVGGQESSWNLTATLDKQMEVFVRNLKALGYKYRERDFAFDIDIALDNSSKPMSYSGVNLIDALTQMAEAWGCEWWIDDHNIRFGRCEFSSPVDFELDVNVNEMTRSDGQNKYATRIYAFGSDRNIPTNYRPVDESMVVNGIVQKRLMLPAGTPYIDAYPDMPIEEAVEEIVVFEDVYPKRVGVMSDITTHEYNDKVEEEGKETVYKKWYAYRFKDSGITFSKDYVIPSKDLRIVFQSGSLNGMEFNIWFNPCDKSSEIAQPEKNPDGSWNPLAQVWEIVRNEDYGRPLPDDSLKPENGDKYVLYGFDTKFVSDAMIPTAENELLERANKYVEKSKIDPSTYTCKMKSNWVFEDQLKRTFSVGDKINLINKTFFETGSRQSRIIGFEVNLDIPYDSPVYTIGETAAYSRLGNIENKLDSLTYKGSSFTGGNSSGGGSSVYVIGVNDKTLPSDRNTFSAKRIINEITERALSSTEDDETGGFIKFKKGISVNDDADFSGNVQVDKKITTLNLLVKELADIYDLNVSHVATLMGTIVKEYISSESFVSGFAGEGMKIYKALSGDWNMEIDNLTVRKVFSIFELMVQKITHQGGMVIRSAAGAKLTKVTDGGSYWKCEHDSTDDFVKDDQIICQSFTGTAIKRYWRLVTSSGAGYFNLSKADCEQGSGTPEVGDEVAVLGNRTVSARQKAQIDCAVGDTAPYRDDYDNINSYSLVGKLITRTGNLSGITDAVFGVLSGSGLYGTNVYLRGTFILKSGKKIEEAIADVENNLGARITATETELSAVPGRITAAISESKTYADNSANAVRQETNAKFEVVNGQISSKVSQDVFNELGRVVSQQGTDISQNKSEILLRASKEEFDALGVRVSSAEASISAQAGQIALKVSADDVKSEINLNGFGVSVFGKLIDFTGKVTFNSMDSATQATINGKATTGYVDSAKNAAISTAAADAQGKADAAKNTANNYTDALRGSLGSLAYESMVDIAKLDSTIIEGGYIKTNLIDVENLKVKYLEGAKGNVHSINIVDIFTPDPYDRGIHFKDASAGTFDLSPDGNDSIPNDMIYGGSVANVLLMLSRARKNTLDRVLYAEGITEFYGSVLVGRGADTNIAKHSAALITDGFSNKGNFMLPPKIVSTSLTLDHTYCWVLCNNYFAITLTLPTTGMLDGQIYFIRKVGNGNINIYGKIMNAGQHNGNASYQTVALSNAILCIFQYSKTLGYWIENISWQA